MLRPERGRDLGGEEMFAEGHIEDAFIGRERTEGIDDLLRILPRPLVGAEVVRAVRDDRAAQAAAELVTLVGLPVHLGQLLGERPRVHRLVAPQREPAAAALIGAAFGHDVEHGAVAAAVFRVEALRQHFKFLNGLEREQLQQPADGVVVVIATVDDVVDVPAVAAADLRRVLRGLR